MDKEDQRFMEKLEEVILKNLSNLDFTINDLIIQLHIGHTKFFYEVKRLTGMTPNQYIQDIKFSKALKLLESKSYKTVKQVAYAVGFKDTKYFSAQFKKRFGDLPSSYL